MADVDFRVNGPERGGGNLNLWLAKQGAQDVGPGSIYTVEHFEGLALVIDRSGGGAGMIRGFLNDGTVNYKTHHSVDSLAFGHCDYSYRNLGRPSQIKFRQGPNSFKVEIDGRLCFETDKVSIPPGYNFGLTAASAENPDSFEIFKMVVMTDDLNAHGDAPPAQQQQQQKQQQQQQQQHQEPIVNRDAGHGAPPTDNADDPYDNAIPDQSPDTYTTSKAQFTDLHNRLQSVNHHLSTIFRSVATQGTVGEKRHEETSQAIHELKVVASKLDRLDTIQNQLSNLERDLGNLKTEMARKILDSEMNLKRMLGDSHGTMLDHVAVQTSPRHGTLIFVIIGGQVALIAAYIWYERKKTLPKKYL